MSFCVAVLLIAALLWATTGKAEPQPVTQVASRSCFYHGWRTEAGRVQLCYYIMITAGMKHCDFDWYIPYTGDFRTHRVPCKP